MSDNGMFIRRTDEYRISNKELGIGNRRTVEYRTTEGTEIKEHEPHTANFPTP